MTCYYHKKSFFLKIETDLETIHVIVFYIACSCRGSNPFSVTDVVYKSKYCGCVYPSTHISCLNNGCSSVFFTIFYFTVDNKQYCRLKTPCLSYNPCNID